MVVGETLRGNLGAGVGVQGEEGGSLTYKCKWWRKAVSETSCHRWKR